ncbi:MAG: Fe-S protein assembly co-chaperone HscB [Gemmataceae bacterium]|nr:Fe-S protein assembly co-chaperone HscB [Gemmataceae bacterium]
MQDYFDRLGLPRRFHVDAADLERAYLARSRAVHPDFHAGGSSADAAASLELSAALNEAYNTLRDPLTRADHLLGLLGGPSAAEEKGQDPAFLAEMMDTRERVESATPADAAVIRAELSEREAGLLAGVASALDRAGGLAAGDPARTKLLAGVRRSLNALKTVRSLGRTLPAD